MGWRVYGEVLETADLNGTSLRVHQKVKFNKDIVLRACRIWLIAYNDPTFTDLTMKIYSSDNGTPKKLLHTSTNVITKAQMITLANGIKEIYFTFDDPTFNGNDYYHFVLFATGYTGSASSHLAWKKGWPDPVYRTGIVNNANSVARAPYDLYFIGADL